MSMVQLSNFQNLKCFVQNDACANATATLVKILKTRFIESIFIESIYQIWTIIHFDLSDEFFFWVIFLQLILVLCGTSHSHANSILCIWINCCCCCCFWIVAHHKTKKKHWWRKKSRKIKIISSSLKCWMAFIAAIHTNMKPIAGRHIKRRFRTDWRTKRVINTKRHFISKMRYRCLFYSFTLARSLTHIFFRLLPYTHKQTYTHKYTRCGCKTFKTSFQYALVCVCFTKKCDLYDES